MTGDGPLLAALAAARQPDSASSITISGCSSLIPASRCSHAPTGWPTSPWPRACPSPGCAPPTPRPTSSTPPGSLVAHAPGTWRLSSSLCWSPADLPTSITRLPETGHPHELDPSCLARDTAWQPVSFILINPPLKGVAGMPANVESMFSVRQMPWHREGTVLADYPGDWDEARSSPAGLGPRHRRRLRRDRDQRRRHAAATSHVDGWKAITPVRHRRRPVDQQGHLHRHRPRRDGRDRRSRPRPAQRQMGNRRSPRRRPLRLVPGPARRTRRTAGR